MTKLRKQRRRKVYHYNRNRKRMRNKQFSEGNVNCKPVKTAWDSKKSVQNNMKEMGLCYDPNVTFKITADRKEKITKAKKLANVESDDEWNVEDIATNTTNGTTTDAKKHVLESLIKDATAPRAKNFKLPKGQIEFLTSMLTKHGLNYKAMAKDKMNYNQETWKQLRGKVRRFQAIPEQYEKFLSTASPETLQKLQQPETDDNDD